MPAHYARASACTEIEHTEAALQRAMQELHTVRLHEESKLEQRQRQLRAHFEQGVAELQRQFEQQVRELHREMQEELAAQQAACEASVAAAARELSARLGQQKAGEGQPAQARWAAGAPPGPPGASAPCTPARPAPGAAPGLL